MEYKTTLLAFIIGMGLSLSATAQTNGSAEEMEMEGATVQSTQAVVAVESEPITDPIPLEDTKKSKWNFDVSLYLLAPGMSGDATIKGIAADVDVGFDKIWDNLHMAGMGSIRIGYGNWSFKTDMIYMDLEADGETRIGAVPVSIGFEQWMVEPSLSYRFDHWCELLAGARYNKLSGEFSGPGVLPSPRVASGTQDWWDPIIGGELNLPFAKKFSINLRGDVGGFGVGSDLTWQAFPYLGWQFKDWGGLQLGYRWLYMDYKDTDEGFAYDVLTQGPQIGFTASF